MIRFILLCLSLSIAAFAQTYTVTVSRDNLMGDAESLIQYTVNGHTETIRGNVSRGSSDGNVTVKRDPRTTDQIFTIHKAQGIHADIWLINGMVDEDFADESDYYDIALSGAKVTIANLTADIEMTTTVPENGYGLAFHAGTIFGDSYIQDAFMVEEMRTYQVKAIDAVTGEYLEDVEIHLDSGRAGDAFEPGFTDGLGLSRQKLPYGSYTARFSKEGYISKTHQFSIGLSDLPVFATIALTRHTDKYRIVLTWGTLPHDLDAHLSGPMPEGGDFHIWWDQMTLIGGRNFLDRDDRHSIGPETITIYHPAAGEYVYAVHDYSHRNVRNSTFLGWSRAVVDIYAGGELLHSIPVESGSAGNTWEVFRITQDDGVRITNRYYDESRSALVIHP